MLWDLHKFLLSSNGLPTIFWQENPSNWLAESIIFCCAKTVCWKYKNVLKYILVQLACVENTKDAHISYLSFSLHSHILRPKILHSKVCKFAQVMHHCIYPLKFKKEDHIEYKPKLKDSVTKESIILKEELGEVRQEASKHRT